MTILFDQGTPAPVRHALPGHAVSTAYDMGRTSLTNGDLLDAAERSFDVLVTTDQNLPYQQNLTGRRLAVLILPTTSWPMLKDRVRDVEAALTLVCPPAFFDGHCPLCGIRIPAVNSGVPITTAA